MTARAGAADRTSRRGFPDPFRLTWQLLANVKFALLLVGIAALFSMVGVLVPQIPEEMRGNPAAESAWLELQRGRFGVFTDPMYRLDFFSVFRSLWFNGLWLLIIVAVTVCTVSRFRPTVRSVHRPQREVGDAYFDQAHHRADFGHEGGVEAVENLLKRRRYRVERVKERDGATYLFAERFAWSQYGTFVSHLALLMLLVGGLLTVIVGNSQVVALSETRPAAPVFADPGPGQIFVAMENAHRGVDDDGNIIDFRSTLEIRQGDETVNCVATVNDPCSAFGYKFHQAAFFNDLAQLRIEGPDGRLLYDDLLDFNAEIAPVPRFVVRNASGNTVFDQALPQLGSQTGPGGTPAASSTLAFRDPETGSSTALPVFWRNVNGEMELFITNTDGAFVPLAEGETYVLPGGDRIRFDEVVPIPRIRLLDMPGSQSDNGAVAQLLEGQDGEALFVLLGVDNRPLIFAPGDEHVTADGYHFRYSGQVNGAGIDVRRDPGHTFIWIAVAMALVGLSITFYVPRRRLWARVTDGRTQLAGVAERTTRFGRELRMMGAELGSKDALLPTDHEERY